MNVRVSRRFILSFLLKKNLFQIYIMYILKVLLLLNYIQSISGEVSLPQWFGDHMVLQSNAEVKSQNSVLNGRAASVR